MVEEDIYIYIYIYTSSLNYLFTCNDYDFLIEHSA